MQSHKCAVGDAFGLALAGSIGESDFNGDFDFGLLNKADVSHIPALTFFGAEFAFACCGKNMSAPLTQMLAKLWSTTASVKLCTFGTAKLARTFVCCKNRFAIWTNFCVLMLHCSSCQMLASITHPNMYIQAENAIKTFSLLNIPIIICFI